MGRIDDAIQTLQGIENGTERALQLAGLISTLFKIKGVVLIVTGPLAFEGYANTGTPQPEIELAPFQGKLAPRMILDIMRLQLHAIGSLYQWNVSGILVRFIESAVLVNRDLSRDFTTGLGVVKLIPVEEITADSILAAVYPEPDPDAAARAHMLLINGLTNAFAMNWPVLHALCHRPEYRVGEELAQMRLAAKREVDAMGLAHDHIGQPAAETTAEASPEIVTEAVPEIAHETPAPEPELPPEALVPEPAELPPNDAPPESLLP